MTSGRHGPTTGALPRKLNALFAHLLSLRGSIRILAPQTNVGALASPEKKGKLEETAATEDAVESWSCYCMLGGKLRLQSSV
jgi:hypothetical protein